MMNHESCVVVVSRLLVAVISKRKVYMYQCCRESLYVMMSFVRLSSRQQFGEAEWQPRARMAAVGRVIVGRHMARRAPGAGRAAAPLSVRHGATHRPIASRGTVSPNSRF